MQVERSAVQPSRKRWRRSWIAAVYVGLLTSSGCSQAPISGRSQLMLVPPQMVAQSSAQAYYSGLAPFKSRGGVDSDWQLTARVNGITGRIIRQATQFNTASANWKWETHVVDTNELNAYCMPGGKMAIYSGLIRKLDLADDEIAAVMAHEIGHAIANHGAEQMSANLGVEILLAAISDQTQPTPKQQQALNDAAALIIKLPHSRVQEAEADRIGIHLMAMAGYHPAAASNLMKKFSAITQGQQTPEFLSDHPSDSSRIRELTALIPSEMPYYVRGYEARSREAR